jgi:predicted dehydrogenase
MGSVLQGITLYEKIDELLDRVPLDALLITTPPASHCGLATRALKRGRHLLIEKPMALNVDEARSIMELSAEVHKKLWVSFNRRFWRPYRILKEKIDGMTQDDIRKVHFHLLLDPQAWNGITPFLGKEDQGGGVLDDVASHQIDLLCWMFGEQVQAVKAEYRKNTSMGKDIIKYEMQFGNALTAECIAGHGNHYREHLELEWNKKKVLAYPACVSEVQYFSERWIHRICNARTSLHWIIRKLMRRPNYTLLSFEDQLCDFAAAIRGENNRQGADAEAGFHCVRTIQACRESIRSGGTWVSLF